MKPSVSKSVFHGPLGFTSSFGKEARGSGWESGIPFISQAKHTALFSLILQLGFYESRHEESILSAGFEGSEGNGRDSEA